MLSRCYTAAVVCAPSRAAFLTGKSTIHSGVRRTTKTCRPRKSRSPRRSSRSDIGRPSSASGIAASLARDGRNRFIRWTRASTSSSATPTPSMPGRSFPTKLWDGREEVAGLGLHRRPDHRPRRRVSPGKTRTAVLLVPRLCGHALSRSPRLTTRWRCIEGKFVEADSELPLKATLCGDGHPARPQHRPPGGDARQLDLARDTLIVFTSDHGATFESGNGGTSAALDSNRRSAARSGRSGRAACECRPWSGGRAGFRRESSDTRSFS